MTSGEVVQRAVFWPHTQSCCIYVLFSLENITISKQSTLAASSRHTFPFNGWRREGEGRKIKENEKVGSDCFWKIKLQAGNQTPKPQPCCCQPHSCSFWYLMLSIIPCTYSLKGITLLPICVYFSSSICLKWVLASWSWDQTTTRLGLIKQVYDLLSTGCAPSASLLTCPWSQNLAFILRCQSGHCSRALWRGVILKENK